MALGSEGHEGQAWDGRVEAEQAEAGKHFGAFEGQAPTDLRRRVQRAIANTGLLPWLEINPLGSIRFTPQIKAFDDEALAYLGAYHSRGFAQANGQDFRDSCIEVATHRPPHSFGQPKRRSGGYSISSWAPHLEEAFARTAVHELGHHFQWRLGRDLALEANHLLSWNQGRALTRYACTNYKEYFAECFVAYFFEARLLQEGDPEGYNLIVRALRGVGLGG